MQIAVRSNALQRQEWLQKGCGLAEVQFVSGLEALAGLSFTVFVDLLYTPDTIHPPFPVGTTVFVHSVTATCSRLPAGAIRINAWPGFLGRSKVEVAATGAALEQVAPVMEALGWLYQPAPDIPGMVSGRVVASIINEAYFALAEAVSTCEEIDTAMKLGTNYPYGPFEWAEKIGVAEVYGLLREMSVTDERYTPAALLVKAGGGSMHSG